MKLQRKILIILIAVIFLLTIILYRLQKIGNLELIIFLIIWGIIIILIEIVSTLLMMNYDEDKYKKIIIRILQGIYFFTVWCILLGYIIYRKDKYFTMEITVLDNISLILFFILTLIPIFSEVDILGIKLKREIEKSKIETEKKIVEMKMDIYTNLINNSNTNTVNYYVNSSDRTLKAIEKDYQGVINNDDRIDIDIDDDSILCLKIRQKIEILLRQIAQKNNIIKNNTTIPLLRVLVNEGLISRKLYDILIEIIIICNNAIHGKKISENHRDFIINTYTQVLLELEEYTKK